MIPLRQGTDNQTVPLGYFLDPGDGNTEKTGLTISNTDIKLHKAGAVSLVSKNAGGATHMANGIYYTALDSTDTNTAGPLTIFVHVSGALPVRLECYVFPQQVYDSLYAGSDKLEVDAVQIEGSDATDRIRDSVVDDETRIDASAINALSSHDPGGTIARDSDVQTLLSKIQGTLASGTHQPQSGDAYAIVNNAGYGNVAIMLTAAGIYDIVSGSYGNAAIKAVLDDAKAVTDKLDSAMEADGAVYRFTQNALEMAPSGGATDWTDSEKQQIRDALGIDGAKLTSQNGKLQDIKLQTDKMAFTSGNIHSHVKAIDDIDFSDTMKSSISSSIFSHVVEGTKTFIEIIRVILSVLAMKTSGSGTNTIKFRDLSDTKDRVVVTVDQDCNRTSVTLDGT